MIKRYKYYDEGYLYRAFGKIILDGIRDLKLDRSIDEIYYVPSHWKKYNRRGYNQAELLAAYISRELGLPLSKGKLVKLKETREQNKLDRRARLHNLDGAFEYKGRSLEGKKILLIDDIFTTGSTLIECSKALRDASCESITGLALTSRRRL